LDPIWAKVMARFATEVDFPSLMPELVTSTDLIYRSALAYWMLVLSVR
jgi:hypothetical protein